MTNLFLIAHSTGRYSLLAASRSRSSWLPDDLLFHLAVVGCAIVVVCLGVAAVERLRIRWNLSARTPRALFRELCRAHRLARSHRHLLAAVAQDAAPEQCCRVFVDPHLIEEFARAHPDEGDECRYLSRLLFGVRSE